MLSCQAKLWGWGAEASRGEEGCQCPLPDVPASWGGGVPRGWGHTVPVSLRGVERGCSAHACLRIDGGEGGGMDGEGTRPRSR